jgi:hypothetical protein
LNLYRDPSASARRFPEAVEEIQNHHPERTGLTAAGKGGVNPTESDRRRRPQ